MIASSIKTIFNNQETNMTQTSPWSSAPTTSAREIANELEQYAAKLGETRDKLAAEIANIDTSVTDLTAQRKATAENFVKATVTELNGDSLDTFAGVAKKVQELGGQDLAIYRNQLIKARDEALALVNAGRADTIDAEGFQTAYQKATTEYEAAGKAKTGADTAIAAAFRDIAAWQQAPEYAFVKLNKTVQSQGAPAISKDNQAYYVPSNVFTAMINYLIRDDAYRSVRKALVKGNHGEKGTDLIAGMAGLMQKDDSLNGALTQANTASAPLDTALGTARAEVQKFAGFANAVKTNGQLLEAVQAKAVTFLETPEVSTAMTGQYAEDFPANLPLMGAKIAVLSKLRDGADEKLQALSRDVAQVAGEIRKARKYRPDQQLPVDIEAYKQQNANRLNHYDNYVTAADTSRNRAYSYAPSPSVIYVDQGPDFFEWMLIENMIDNNMLAEEALRDNGGYAPYTADLLGVNRDYAQNAGITLPDQAFDFSSIDNSSTGSQPFDFNAAPSIDLSSTFDTVREEAPASSGFDTGYTRTDYSDQQTSFDTSGPSRS
jgi:hypothetical protein